MSKESITQYYEKFSSVLEKARKSPWNRVAFLGGVAWLLYQQMFIWGFALFVIYGGWADECISSKSVEYYEKAFSRLEETGKHTWNWAAFFGGITWLLYRKTYLYAIAFTIMYFGMDVLLGIYAVPDMGGESGMAATYIILFEILLPRVCLMLLAYSSICFSGKFVYHFTNGWSNVETWEIWTVAIFLTFIITRICLGYFGNSWYYGEVKDKIKKGYHLKKRHCPTSIPSCFSGLSFLLGLVTLSSSKKYTVDKKSIRAYLNPNR